MPDLLGYSKLDLRSIGLDGFEVYYRDVNGGRAVIFKGAPTELVVLDEQNSYYKVSFSLHPRSGLVLHHCECLKDDYCYVQVVPGFVHSAISHIGGRHQYANRLLPVFGVEGFKSVLNGLETGATESTLYLQRRLMVHPLSLIFKVGFGT